MSRTFFVLYFLCILYKSIADFDHDSYRKAFFGENGSGLPEFNPVKKEMIEYLTPEKGNVIMIGYTENTPNVVPWIPKFMGLSLPHSGVMLVNSTGSCLFCTKTFKGVVCRYYDNILFKSKVTEFWSVKTHKTISVSNANDNVEKWINDRTPYSIFNMFGGKNCHLFTKSVFGIKQLPLKITTGLEYVLQPFM